MILSCVKINYTSKNKNKIKSNIFNNKNKFNKNVMIKKNI